MKINYIAKKIFNRYEIYKLKKNQIDDNLYLKNNFKKKIQTIILFFPDYKYMHLGDHLFFEPLARGLQNEGYSVFIYPIKEMEFYFRKLDYKIGDEILLNTVDLVITKVEFISHLKKLSNQIIFFDTTSSKTKFPLCLSILKQLFSYLKINCTDFKDAPLYIKSDGLNVRKFINNDANYILFNNYIDSGFFRSGKKNQKKIIDFLKKLKNKKSYLIIHTGSKKDKESDPHQHEYVDIDLRGLTSIEDIFYLAALENVKYNVSFDGFQMHLFFIQKKKSFILFRGRYLKKNEKYIKSYVNPPFVCDSNISDLIEYIE